MDKIIFLIGNVCKLGGAQGVCVKLAEELHKRGLKVEIKTLSSSSESSDLMNRKSLNITAFKATRYRSVLPELYSFVSNNKDGRVLVFSYEFLILLWIVGFVVSPKLVVFRNINTFSQILENVSSRHGKYLLKVLMRKSVHYPKVIINQSNAMDMDFKKSFPINKTVVINNPVLPSGHFATKERFSLKPGYVIFVGRLEKQKDLDFAVETFSEFIKSTSKATKLVICGDGTEKHRLMRKVTSMSLSHSIIFLGECNELEDLYRNAHCLILTSLYEGFPNVLIEANRVGTPVISLDINSGPSEIILEGRNGLLVKKRDHRSFATALRNSFKIEWNRTDISYLTQRRYGIREITNQYEKVLLD